MLVKCPRCHGHGFEGATFCSMCEGIGEVNKAQPCECGRPAVEKVKDKFVCTDPECLKRAMEGIDTGTGLHKEWDERYGCMVYRGC